MESEFLARLFQANLTGAVAVIVVLAFRRPIRRIAGAQTAYQLWLIVPVAMLAALLPPRIVFIPVPAPISALLPPEIIAAGVRPSAGMPIPMSPPRQHAYYLIGLWLFGVAISLVLLLIGQLLARAQFGRITADAGDPQLGRASNSRVGPALLGAIRPKIVIPNDFEARFDENERAMILAHERTHLAKGHAAINGLTAIVGALNWFNPFLHVAARVARIDQELACDAAVTRRFPEKRQAYAHALLKTQIAFTSLPLGCDWPVRSPHRLEERIAMLAEGNPGRKRLIIGGAVVTVLTAGAGLAAWASEPPVEKFAKTNPTQITPANTVATNNQSNGMAVVASSANLQATGSETVEASRPLLLAQVQTPTPAAPTPAPNAVASPSPDTPAQLLAEQERPRRVVAFEPAHFDRYVGYYELPSKQIFRITRAGDKYYSQLTGQGAVEFYPESETKFFTTVVAAQISFVVSAQGRTTGLVLHQNGLEQPAQRIDETTATSQAATLAQRIASNTPSAGTAAFLRRYVDSLEIGAPDYSQMAGPLADAARAQQATLANSIKSWGPLQSIQFRSVTPQGSDVYNAVFSNAEIPVLVSPSDADGKTPGLLFMSQVGKITPTPEVADRIRSNRPSAGTEASVRKWLASIESGEPDYDDMAPGLAEAARQQWPQTRQRIQAFGALESVRFARVDPQGRDVYLAIFQNNRAEVSVSPLDVDGKVLNRTWQIIPLITPYNRVN